MKFLHNIIKDLDISYAITQAVHKFLNLEDVFKVALDMTIDLPDVDMAFIYLIDFRKNEAVLRAQRNLPDFYIQGAGRIPYPKGITWKIIESGKILRVKNIQKEPHVGPSGRKLGHQGVLGIPITINDKVIGVLYFATYKERHFSDQAVDLLTSIGNQIAMAVAKAQLYRELSRKNQYKTIAVIISQAVHKSIDLIDILENSTESMIKNLNNTDNIDIYLIENTKAVLKAHRGFNDQYIKQVKEIFYPKGLIWKAIMEKKLIYCEDIEKEEVDEFIKSIDKEMGIKSKLCIPILHEGNPVGILNISSLTQNAFEDDDIKLLSLITQQIEVAIHNAKQTAKILESEERYQTVIEHNFGVICETNNVGQVIRISSKFDLLGYKSEDFLGRSVFDHIHPDDYPSVLEEFDRVIKYESPRQIAFRFKHKNRGWHWIEGTASPLISATGESRVIIFCRDITRRKRAEDKLKKSHQQLSELTRHLQSVREEERKRIAREIHDSFGQTLTGLQMSLSWLSKKLSKSGDDLELRTILLDELSNISKHINSAVEGVQELISELRPVVLDDFGLISAIDWQIKKFENLNSIKCKFKSTVNDVTLPSEMSTAVFRILQEILTNVARHAKATKTYICLNKFEDNLILDVRDNGRGIKQSEIESPESFGIIGMRERILPLGGKLNIIGKSGKGTRVTVEIPLNERTLS